MNALTSLFQTVFSMSVTGAWVILAVLVIRALLNRAPKKYRYLLWAAAGFRLCCPVSLRSAFSLLRFAPGMETAAPVLPETPGMLTRLTPAMPPAMLPPAAPQNSADPIQILTAIAAIVWVIGMAAVLSYGLWGSWKVHRQTATATRMEGNVWQAENIGSPFILGLIHPKIFIPYRLSPEALGYVLAHERYHLRRGDPIVKAFAFLLLSVHWFNPLCWVAFWLMDRDMEMSCDEHVLATLGSRKAYSTTLLSFAANRRFPLGTPLAFGEHSVRRRIRNALHWRRPKAAVTVVCTLLCAAVLVACAVNPGESEPVSTNPPSPTETEPEESRYDEEQQQMEEEIRRQEEEYRRQLEEEYRRAQESSEPAQP